jgi:flagellar hook-length control protein FliK
MTNLPITPSAPQTAAISAQAANNSETGDTQNSPPFGEVLARQVKEPAAKNARGNDKLAVDALAQLGADSTDEKQADITTDGTSRLPADMLAALLPQIMNTTATPASTVNADADAVTGDTKGTALDKRSIAASKGGVATEIQTEVTPKTATLPTGGIQIKEQSFVAALNDSANRTASGMESGFSAPREIIAAATTPQPNAFALASLQNTVAPVWQTAQATISTSVTQERWGDEFSQKVTWIASSKQDQSAELHLNPPQLGPLDVVIKVSGDQATALFTSPHAAVREAIEQALPKLRDMLSDNGITLGNATVSDQSPRDQNGANTRRSSASTSRDIPDILATNSSALRVSQISRHNGIVDTFA